MPLTPKQQRVVSEQLESLGKTLAKRNDFGTSKKNQAEAEAINQAEAEAIKNELLDQKGYHREKLLKFVMRMTVASFGLLAFAVIYQMVVRVWLDTYTGVSDSVIKTLTVGVFGQVIGIVASIVLVVWKDSN